MREGERWSEGKREGSEGKREGGEGKREGSIEGKERRRD